jgi:hypothetical protein
MLDALTRQLFSARPQETLYHYTTLTGLQGIVGGAELRASDIRYMNDSTELRHTLELLNQQVTRRILSGVDNPELLNALLDWLSHRIVSGPMLFGASFRANGNLLSQWRGYSVHGKGVSMGMSPEQILCRAAAQSFEVTRCIYSRSEQERLINSIVDAVESLAGEHDMQEIANGEPWQGLFQRIEGDLLRIAAVLKHPTFEEEQEWRIISPVMHTLTDRVEFREGISMLIPYFNFDLRDEAGRLMLEHVYLGPTSNTDLSMNSLALYLEQCGASPRRGITYCDIPYRKR